MKTSALIAAAALLFGAFSMLPVAAAAQSADGGPGAAGPSLAWIPKSSSAVVVGLGDSTMLGAYSTKCVSLGNPGVHFAAGSSSWGACSLDRIGYATGATIVNLGNSGSCFFACGSDSRGSGSIYSTYQAKLAPYVGSHYNGNQYFIIQGGINDAQNATAVDVEVGYQDMRNVIAWLNGQGVPYSHIEISAVLPSNPAGSSGQYQKRGVVAGLNAAWARVALDPAWAGQVVVGDNYDAILACLSTCMYTDGTHLNDTGYNVQANAWMAANPRNAYIIGAANFPEFHVGGDETGMQVGELGTDTPSAYCMYSKVGGGADFCLFTSTTSGAINGIYPTGVGLIAQGTTDLAMDGQSNILAVKSIRAGSDGGADATCPYSYGTAVNRALVCLGSNSSGGAVQGVSPSALFVQVASTDLVAVDARSGDLGVQGALKARTATLAGLTPSRFVATDANKNLTSAGTAYFNGSPVPSLHFEGGAATITLSSQCAALSACGAVTVDFGSAYTSASSYSCNVNLEAGSQNAATLTSLATPVVSRTSASQATFMVHAILAVTPGTTSQVVDWRCHGS